MKGNLRIIACITGTIAAVATGVYASWKFNRKYQDYKHLKKEVEAIPYEIERNAFRIYLSSWAIRHESIWKGRC